MADTCLATIFHSALTPHVRTALREALDAASLGGTAAWFTTPLHAAPCTFEVYPVATSLTGAERPPLPPATELCAFLSRAAPGALAVFPCHSGVWCVRANCTPLPPDVLGAYGAHLRVLEGEYSADKGPVAYAVLRYMLAASSTTGEGGAELATFMFSEGTL